jgi:hypothetical protein
MTCLPSDGDRDIAAGICRVLARDLVGPCPRLGVGFSCVMMFKLFELVAMFMSDTLAFKHQSGSLDYRIPGVLADDIVRLGPVVHNLVLDPMLFYILSTIVVRGQNAVVHQFAASALQYAMRLSGRIGFGSIRLCSIWEFGRSGVG